MVPGNATIATHGEDAYAPPRYPIFRARFETNYSYGGPYSKVHEAIFVRTQRVERGASE
jgi:hypothetical protein